MNNNLFQTIVKNIEYDSLHSTQDNYIVIEEQDNNHITIFDAIDGEINSLTYTIYNPNLINKEYITKRVIFSDDALYKSSLFRLDIEAIIDYLTNKVDKNMLLTIEKIAFVTNEEAEDDSIFKDKNIEEGLLAGHCFPDENDIGLLWWDENIILINTQAIQNNATYNLREMCITNETEIKKETSLGIVVTMLHEIRHAAQNNSYLPEEILDLISEDEEVDAEEYARNWFEQYPTYILKD